MNTSFEKFNLILVAAGTSARFGNKTPKQYYKINGKTILRHTLDAFINHPALNEICIVIHPDHKQLFSDATKGIENIRVCHGSDSRKSSVYNGLKNIASLKNNNTVLIHDAARPFVTHTDIDNLLHAMQLHKGATLATPITDTLRKENGDNVERDNLWAIQTPQAFDYKTLKRAHENANPQKTYTDDTSLVCNIDIEVEFVQTSRENIKITYAQDIELANKILSKNHSTETRIGQGFDVHAFEDQSQTNTQPTKNIRLCGIDIPHDRKLKGHSDADVGLHALTDAIYGAIGAGDIGLHFPPSNDDFKNMDSAIFLEHALKMLLDKDGKIINADLTLICEAPKITPHRTTIQTRIAQILNIEINRINIKATTTEQLGFTGRKEGIAAQAVISVSLPVKGD